MFGLEKLFRSSRVADLEARLAAERAASDRMAVRLAVTQAKMRAASGVAMSGGQFTYEANTKLRGKDRYDVFRKMECDPRIAAALQGARLPLILADWKFEPAGKSAKDEDVAEFCNSVLLHVPSDKYGREYWTLTSWKAQRLPEILSMLSNGFSAFHKSWRVVGGKKVYDRLTWLEPKSVDPSGWDISDQDEILRVRRTFLDPSLAAHTWEPIEADDLALYPWDLLGARFEGTPWIRSMYGAWMRKDALLRYAVLHAAHVASPIPMGFFPQNWSEEDKTNFAGVVQDIRRSDDREDLYFTGPLSPDGKEPVVKFAGAEFGEVDRVSGLVELENSEIAQPGAQKSQSLGETQTGSRAVGSVMQSREMQLYRAMAEIVIEWEMYGVGNLRGVVEHLVQENFGDALLPRLMVENIDPSETDALLNRIILAKPHLPSHPAVTRKIATLCGFSAEDIPDDDLQEKAGEDGSENPESGSDSSPGGPPPPEQDTEEEEPEEAEDGTEAALSAEGRKSYWLSPMKEGRPKAGGFRYPNRLESEICRLAQISETLRVGEADLASTLKRINRQMIDELNGRVASGKIIRRNLDSQRRSKPRGLSRMRVEVADVADEIGAQGAGHAAEEIERALSRASLAAAKKSTQKVHGIRIAAEFLAEFEEEVRMVAQISVDALWNRLLEEGLAEYNRLYRQGYEGAELERRFAAFMDALSEKPVEDAARKAAGVSYNQGRDMTLMTAKKAGLVSEAVRSEVLDDRTCSACEVLDGTWVEVGSDEYYRLMPPALCEGGERCRGFYVVLPAEEAA